MKKALSVIITAALVIAVFSGCSRVKEVDFSPELQGGAINVVTFNVAGPWGNSLKGTGAGARVKRFAAYMNAVKPDIIGTQEMNYIWEERLAELMPDYDCYGIERGGDDNEKKSEKNSILWLKDKYECVEKNTFWLSETPEVVSRYEGAGCNRVCSYVMLRDKETDKYILALNTHLDNVSDESRAFGAQVILDKLEQLRAIENIAQYTTVLTGDFNDYLDSPGCKLILDSGYNAYEQDRNTYQDWGSITEGRPIDFIFTDGEIRDYLILDDKTNGFVSDHYGVLERIDLKY